MPENTHTNTGQAGNPNRAASSRCGVAPRAEERLTRHYFCMALNCSSKGTLGAGRRQDTTLPQQQGRRKPKPARALARAQRPVGHGTEGGEWDQKRPPRPLGARRGPGGFPPAPILPHKEQPLPGARRRLGQRHTPPGPAPSLGLTSVPSYDSPPPAPPARPATANSVRPLPPSSPARPSPSAPSLFSFCIQ
ncbi:Hypothetical predicted protein [Podarcis lilfordi]|uniref:Uncharacterized protein n=1 Tax=Podarcis lilfordi TaxID=74358 RepID=A0AA35L6U5_9SAUR|nr:Hypothetical predicted protein [Podarcis lilfordi]